MRSRIYLAVFGVVTVGLLSAAVLVSVGLPRQAEHRIARTLESEARLIADDLVRHNLSLAGADIDAEADRLHRFLGARVTLIAASGVVLGDSAASGQTLRAMDSHAVRPEVVQAAHEGVGRARRRSDTLQTDVLYVAVRTTHPAIATVRLALPLSEVRAQVAAIRAATLVALGLSLIAAIGSARASSVFRRRLTALAASAKRYAGM